jgi:hypothetical protein
VPFIYLLGHLSFSFHIETGLAKNARKSTRLKEANRKSWQWNLRCKAGVIMGTSEVTAWFGDFQRAITPCSFTRNYSASVRIIKTHEVVWRNERMFVSSRMLQCWVKISWCFEKSSWFRNSGNLKSRIRRYLLNCSRPTNYATNKCGYSHLKPKSTVTK